MIRPTRGLRVLLGVRLQIITHPLFGQHAGICCVPLQVVSERVGHLTPAFTMAVYQHVLPGMRRDTADHFARLMVPDEDVMDGGSRSVAPSDRVEALASGHSWPGLRSAQRV